MARKNHQPTAAEIISKLPLHQQLDASRAMLVKLSPIWQSWAQLAVDEKRLSADCYQHSQLSSVQRGKLVLACNNAVNASQIKHQKQNLLESLHNRGFIEIEQITVRIQHPVSKDFDHELDKWHEAVAPVSFINPSFVEPSKGSHQAIENILKIVKSDRLADSLRKLSATLKSF